MGASNLTNLSESQIEHAITCEDRRGLGYWYDLQIGKKRAVEVVQIDVGDVIISYVHGELTEKERERVGELLYNSTTVHYIELGACF